MIRDSSISGADVFSARERPAFRGAFVRAFLAIPVFPAVCVAALLLAGAWGLALAGCDTGDNASFAGYSAGMLCLLVAVCFFAGQEVPPSGPGEHPGDIVRNVLLFFASFIPIALMLTFAALGLTGSPRSAGGVSAVRFVALVACLIPATLGVLPYVRFRWIGELAARGIVPASPDALEKSAKVDAVLLGGLSSVFAPALRVEAFVPAPKVEEDVLVRAARCACRGDGSPLGKAILDASRQIVVPGEDECPPDDAESPDVRMGAPEEIVRFVGEAGGDAPRAVRCVADDIVRSGGVAVLVAKGDAVLGTIHLRRTLRGSFMEPLKSLRRWGVRTLLIDSGDEADVASAVAGAGIDDFIAGATPDIRNAALRRLRSEGRVLAGMSPEDAERCDVVLSPREGEGVDFVTRDDCAARLRDVVATGKRFAALRSLLMLFGFAVDASKCAILVPALLGAMSPDLRAWDVLGLSGVANAAPLAMLFNVLVLLAEILLLHGSVDIPSPLRKRTRRRFLLAWGAAGLLAPFVYFAGAEYGLSILSSGLDRLFG